MVSVRQQQQRVARTDTNRTRAGAGARVRTCERGGRSALPRRAEGLPVHDHVTNRCLSAGTAGARSSCTSTSTSPRSRTRRTLLHTKCTPPRWRCRCVRPLPSMHAHARAHTRTHSHTHTHTHHTTDNAGRWCARVQRQSTAVRSVCAVPVGDVCCIL